MKYITNLNDYISFNEDIKKLYYKGNLELLKMPKIGIVGSRKMSVYTKNQVSLLASKLSKLGFCIVSGGALGVDIEAAKASFPNTIAVFANSLDLIYPKSNESIIKQIYENALAFSEFEEKHLPKKHDFLQRNRLVVALSDILIIAQADFKSGSLNSANHALKQNKPIYVLAQRIDESNGTNELLAKNQAKLIYDINIFLNELKSIYNLDNISMQVQKDELLDFCKSGAYLDEVLVKFGDSVYDYELDGKVIIDGVLVRSV